MLAGLLDPRVVLMYQNTGREHDKTLEFLHHLEEGLGRPIVWMEFRKPKVKGAPPREFRFEIVNFKTAARKGEPFDDLLEALTEHRETKKLPPITPWARQRLCTAYLKHKTGERYIASLGIKEYDTFVGLRHDEPDRVHKLKGRDTQTKVFRCGLFDAKITKPDVLEFWAGQSFNLEIEEIEGNCTGCFLKDQSDLARVLNRPETDAEWWYRIQAKYPGFGGFRSPSYRQLASELPVRLAIEEALRKGEEPPTEFPSIEKRRLTLLTRQETRRFKNEIPSFSCACEASMVNDPDALVEGVESLDEGDAA